MYLGDYNEDNANLNFKFTTRDTDAAPFTLAGTPVVSVYKGNADGTEKTSAEAYITLTVDFDGKTGLNHVEIDLSTNAFWATGNDYQIVITTGTVNGNSVVGEVVADFSIENRYASVDLVDDVWDEVLTGSTHNDPTSAGRRLRQVEEAIVHASGVIAAVTNGHTFTLDAGAVATGDYYIGERLTITEGAGAGQSRIITAYTAGKVITLDSDFVTNPNTSSLYEIDSADVSVAISDIDLAKGFVATYTNTTTITLDAGALADADYYVDTMIIFTHGTGAGQSRLITAYTAGRVATLSPALDTALDTTTAYHVQAVPITPKLTNAEMVDVVNVDTITLPGQEAPPLNPTRTEMSAWIYKTLRNRKTQTATLWQLLADNETTVDAKATVSDDGTTAVKQEIESGP